MEFIGTIAILALIVFVIYRTGLMRLTQTASERAIAVTDSATQVWELSSLEKHSKALGKIHNKLDDESVTRSSASSIRAKLSELEHKEETPNATNS